MGDAGDVIFPWLDEGLGVEFGERLDNGELDVLGGETGVALILLGSEYT
jgi:hypothetical protein